MKTRMLWTAAAAALLVAFAAGPVMAQDAKQPPKPEKIQLTPEQKAEAKAKRKADLAEAKAKGETTKAGEGTGAKPYKAAGTHATRSAERKANRKKIAEQEKKGEIAHTGDAAPKK